MELTRDAVHVWRAATMIAPSRLARLRDVLAPDEHARAARFVREEDRRRYTVARGVLRTLLGRYLNVDPVSLEFCYGAHGKPSLTETPLTESPGGRDVRFNMSHSGGLALHAFAVGREVGVDVERIRPRTDIVGVARRSFSPAEVDALMTLPVGQRREAFFNGWTRKEAFVKAHGEGIALGLSRFDVTLRPGEPAELLRFDNDPGQAARWRLRALDAGAGYKAALAVEGGGWHLGCWDYFEGG